MSKEIIINVTGEHSRIAIVEDGELVELYIENPENVRTIGDIYLGRVRRILPGIKAAFVDIGQKQDAFLHFSDLSDNLQDLLELSDGKIPDWSKKPLKKAPKQDEDGDSGLELETPEEQRAARRRRDLKRTRNRRGRGKKKDATDAPSQDDKQANATSAKADQPESKPKKTGSRRAESTRSDIRAEEKDRHVQPAPPQPPVSDELPDAPPAIIPPEAVAPPPSKDEAAETEAKHDDDQQGSQRSRRRRGGRGRGRGCNAQQRTEQPDAEQPESTQPEEPKAQHDDTAATTDRRDDAKKREPSSRSRSGRGRRQTSSSDEQRSEQQQERSEQQPERSKQKKERTPRPSEERAPEAKVEEAPKPRPKKKASPARSSRFVIDLTSKSSRVDRDDVEEEEEEEEKKGSSRNRRRGGRRRGRRRGGSSNSDSSNKSNGSNKSSGRKSSGGGSGRGRRGRSSGNGGERPEKHLKQDQKLIVKITKEPISSKGPRVSTDVSLAGRFLVLIPQADYVAVSKKIESSKERRRLRALARSLLPEGFGLIVRTVAEKRDAKALDTDLRLLLEKWRKIEDQLRDKPKPPKPLYEDVNMVSSIIRDLFSEDYDRIVVDDPKVHKHVKGYVQAVAPQMAANVTLHKSKEHVFRTYKIERDVRAAFETRVPLPGGGYLFIEHTEAMHVVDVNSGRAGRGLSQEENSLRVNLESAREIAKQLRLRDLGGIICVDFIDMRSHSARQKVYDELKKEFRKDRAVTKLLPMSDFGVVEITRQRLRPSITTTTNIDDLPPLEELPEPEPRQAAPVAAAASDDDQTGPQPTTDEVVAHLDRWLMTYRAEVQDQHRKRPILVRVHPLLGAYLNRGIPSLLTRWKLRTRLKFRLDPVEDADPLSFSVRDEKSGKNLTKKYDPDRRNDD